MDTAKRAAAKQLISILARIEAAMPLAYGVRQATGLFIQAERIARANGWRVPVEYNRLPEGDGRVETWQFYSANGPTMTQAITEVTPRRESHLPVDPDLATACLRSWIPLLREIAEQAEPVDAPAKPGPAPAPVDYIDMDQAAALVNRSKRSLEGKLSDGDMPAPDIKGVGGKKHEWVYARLRPWLGKTYDRILPDRPPHAIR